MAAEKILYFSEERLHAVAVKQGFCWPAFWFGSLWAIVKHMWVPAFWSLAVCDLLLWFLTGYAEAHGAFGLALCGALLTILYAYVRGRWGNRWLAASLLDRGYAKGPSLTLPSA